MTDYSQEEKAVAATAIFKIKVQQTVERIKKEHFQNTCGVEMIFEENAYEEDEEIHMEDFVQAPPKFEDTKPQAHDLMGEVNLDTVEEPRITYISSLLPSNFKEGIIATLHEFKDFFAWNYDEMLGLDKSLVEHHFPIKPEFHPFNNHPEECPRR